MLTHPFAFLRGTEKRALLRPKYYPRARKSASGSPHEGIKVGAAFVSRDLGTECQIGGDTSPVQGEVAAGGPIQLDWQAISAKSSQAKPARKP